MDKGGTAAWLGLQKEQEDGKHGFLSRKGTNSGLHVRKSLLAAAWRVGRLKAASQGAVKGKDNQSWRLVGQGYGGRRGIWGRWQGSEEKRNSENT